MSLTSSAPVIRARRVSRFWDPASNILAKTARERSTAASVTVAAVAPTYGLSALPTRVVGLASRDGRMSPLQATGLTRTEPAIWGAPARARALLSHSIARPHPKLADTITGRWPWAWFSSLTRSSSWAQSKSVQNP